MLINFQSRFSRKLKSQMKPFHSYFALIFSQGIDLFPVVRVIRPHNNVDNDVTSFVFNNFQFEESKLKLELQQNFVTNTTSLY